MQASMQLHNNTAHHRGLVATRRPERTAGPVRARKSSPPRTELLSRVKGRALGSFGSLPSMFTTLPQRNDAAQEGGNDLTSNMLQGVIKVALQSRLRQHSGIQVNVESNAMDIMSGKFGGISIKGERWRTPLQLTAERIDVALGELVMNYRALVLEQKISLRNVPKGKCTITLTAADLGNFVVHKILEVPISTAVDGQAFQFDGSSVRFWMDPKTKEGSIYLEGEWAGDESRYSVKMTPGNVSRAKSLRIVAHRVGAGTMSSSGSDSEESLSSADGDASAEDSVLASVSSEEGVKSSEPTLEQKIAAAAAAILNRSNGTQHGAESSSDVEEVAQSYKKSRVANGVPAVCKAAIIEKGLYAFFTDLKVDLQGIELSQPSLTLLMPKEPKKESASSSKASSESAAETSTPTPPEQPLLTITMGLQMRQVPPIDMQF